MQCPRCGRRTPPDRETGYDAEEICPDCRASVEVTVTVDFADETQSWRASGADPIRLLRELSAEALAALTGAGRRRP